MAKETWHGVRVHVWMFLLLCNMMKHRNVWWVISRLHHGCITHCMMYNLVSVSSHSLQLDLSMLILKSVVKTMKNIQYKTAGTCLKRFYAAHQVLKLFVRIIASFQVVLAKLAMPKFSLQNSVFFGKRLKQRALDRLVFDAAWWVCFCVTWWSMVMFVFSR